MRSLAIYIRTFKHDYMSAVAGSRRQQRAAIHHRLCLLYRVNGIPGDGEVAVLGSR